MNETQSNTFWAPLADALRMELQEYGALSVLIDEQQKAILHREMMHYMDLSTEIEEQIASTSGLRAEREQMVRDIGKTLGFPEPKDLKSMLVHFPEEARPLLAALIDEINSLIHKTRRKASQNQMLLARALQYTHELLLKTVPQGVTQTYGARGDASVRTHVAAGSVNFSA